MERSADRRSYGREEGAHKDGRFQPYEPGEVREQGFRREEQGQSWRAPAQPPLPAGPPPPLPHELRRSLEHPRDPYARPYAGHGPAGHGPPGHGPPGHGPRGHGPPGHGHPGHAAAGHGPPGYPQAGHSSPGLRRAHGPGQVPPGHAPPVGSHAPPGHGPPGHVPLYGQPGHGPPGHGPGSHDAHMGSGTPYGQAGMGRGREEGRREGGRREEGRREEGRRGEAEELDAVQQRLATALAKQATRGAAAAELQKTGVDLALAAYRQEAALEKTNRRLARLDAKLQLVRGQMDTLELHGGLPLPEGLAQPAAAPAQPTA